MVRLNELENFVMKEVPKIDHTSMITSDLGAFKEVIKDVRKQQEIQTQQLNQMKILMNDKNTLESSISNTSKEK